MRFLVLFLVLAASAAHGHTPSYWLDLPVPVPVPTALYDATLTAAHEPYEGTEWLAEWYKNNFADDWAAVAVSFEGQDELVSSLDSEQVSEQAGCHYWHYQNTNRYSIAVRSEVAVVNPERAGCSSCLTDPNGAGCYVGRATCISSITSLGADLLTIGRLPHLVHSKYLWNDESNLVVRFHFYLNDNAICEGYHRHEEGTGLHEGEDIHRGGSRADDWSPWYLMSALRSGNGAPTSPAEPAEPVEPEVEEPVEEPAAPSVSVRIDTVYITVRDTIRTAVGGGRQVVRDTVEVVRHDTLLYCPQTDEERRDLFDLFTGVDDDTTETEGPAGKAASVEVSSWGAIKALIQEE